ncbi:MAG: potassium transporter TrkG [Gammaproteobacteria bacterium]
MSLNYANGAARPNEHLHRFAAVQQVLGLLLMVFSLTMLPPIAVSWWYEDGAARAFGQALWITLATGAVVWWPVRREQAELKIRDGFLVTVLFWAVLSAFGAIPLYVTDSGWHTFTDAMFEATSGLTTTGSTVVAKGIDDLPQSINYYRAQLHWLGGVGVIVLAVAVLPMLGVGGMQLFKAETPGPMKDARLTPRIAGTARALWLVYVWLTVAAVLTFWWLGMSFFDAVCHAMSALATGGFSTHDASIGYFNSADIEIAAMVFMIAGASNFALHYLAWQQRNVFIYLRDSEFLAFAATLIGFSVLVCVPLYVAGTYPDFPTAVRKGMFQLVAYATDAGFATADPTHWPWYVPMLLLLSAFMTACAGGTGGGVKAVRIVLFVKQALREMRRLIHPSAELTIKLNGRVVPDEVVTAIGGFFSVYIGMTIVLTFAMMLTGLDAVTAFSAVAATINNMGPGLGSVNAHMADVTDFGKWTLTFAMLLGRLEIFTLLILFTPGFWRR